MTTVVNSPGGGGEGMGVGFIIGIIVAIAVVALLAVYGLPALRANQAPQQKEGSIDVNIKLPTGEDKAPEGAEQK